MGRAARWFRGLLLGGKKAGEPPEAKRLWGYGKSFREKHHHQQQPHREELRLPLYAEYEKERSKRAIAVAAATAAVAEAAVAAAQAAAVVVRLTASGGRTERNLEEEWAAAEAAAAVKIQSTFRGYLARRALKALRGLVKLQALVRGNFVRKQTAETLRCMQALVRVQARARACRVLSSTRSQLPAKAFLPRASLCSPNPGTDEDYERAIRPIACSNRYFSLRRNSSRMEVGRAFWWDDDDAAARKATNFSPANDNAKILEVDLGSFARSREMSNHHCYHYSSCNTRSFPTVLASPSKDSSGESSFLYYGASSLQGSSRKKVDDDGDAQSLWSGCVHCCPNYMAKTESSMAKLRSHSAPRQRPVGKRSSSHVGGQLPPLLVQQRSGPPPPPPSRHAKFTNRANPGSGRLDRLETPLKN